MASESVMDPILRRNPLKAEQLVEGAVRIPDFAVHQTRKAKRTRHRRGVGSVLITWTWTHPIRAITKRCWKFVDGSMSSSFSGPTTLGPSCQLASPLKLPNSSNKAADHNIKAHLFQSKSTAHIPTPTHSSYQLYNYQINQSLTPNRSNGLRIRNRTLHFYWGRI